MDDDPRTRFTALYEQNYPRIAGYVLRRCGSPEDAADVVAETFTVAWRRVAEIPPGEQARLWLYGVARRTLANHLRGERRHARRAAALRDELAAHAVGHRTELATDSPAARAFARLTAADRELLALVAWEGLRPGEIAVVLACSRNAVSIRLHRARRRFARALADLERTPAEPARSYLPTAFAPEGDPS